MSQYLDILVSINKEVNEMETIIILQAPCIEPSVCSLNNWFIAFVLNKLLILPKH